MRQQPGHIWLDLMSTQENAKETHACGSGKPVGPVSIFLASDATKPPLVSPYMSRLHTEAKAATASEPGNSQLLAQVTTMSRALYASKKLKHDVSSNPLFIDISST